MPMQLWRYWQSTGVEASISATDSRKFSPELLQSCGSKKGGVLHHEYHLYMAWNNFLKSYTYCTSKTESLFKHSSKVIFLDHLHRHIDDHTFIFSETSQKWWGRHQLFNGYSNCIFHPLEICFSWATISQHLVSLTLLSFLSVTDFSFPGS